MSAGQPRLRTVPTTLREANAFVAAHHRHHRPVRGHTSSTAVVDDQGELRGVAIIGRPLARKLDHTQVCEVLRVATDGCQNACSALYGACCRIAKAFGYAHVLTYTLSTEPGTSLRAAGWKPTALTDGGSWSRQDREREDDHPLIPKVRWECRCSAAPAIELEAAA